MRDSNEELPKSTKTRQKNANVLAHQGTKIKEEVLLLPLGDPAKAGGQGYEGRQINLLCYRHGWVQLMHILRLL